MEIVFNMFSILLKIY